MNSRQSPKFDHGTSRLEAFSDGVFAIAITLLVLEIHIPMEGGVPLGKKLLQLWPSYFAYVLSFITIGIYWANHHHFMKLFQGVDHLFRLINVVFLMIISFLPFPTMVLARNYRTPDCKTAVVFYVTGLLLAALGWISIWLYGRWKGLLDPSLAPAYVRFLTIQFGLSNFFYAAALLLALWHPTVGLVVCVGLTLLYLLPPKPALYL